jgi:hypothetical protein
MKRDTCKHTCSKLPRPLSLDWLLPGQTDVFIHVESDNVLEAKFTSLEELNQLLVGANRGGTSRETQNERTFSRGLELVDALFDIVGYYATAAA